MSIVGDAYARFLIEEVLPEIKKKWNITDDPNQRAVAGSEPQQRGRVEHAGGAELLADGLDVIGGGEHAV